MKRDWDLIREILIAVEDLPDTTSRLNANAITEYDAETVSYHMSILNEAGLIVAQCSKTKPILCFANSLTWEGHEFLDKIRQQSAWNKIKTIVRDKGLDLSYEALKIALGAVITNTF
ncbi:DUF2513 domain-containing protein [Entomomonas moraniae]|uniref:DUF2513 domain-containing protein n=1 Tax=Entomomonas moraniae TaxID=2213226 RepID=A0A3Q9JIH2_9GAMM|nr:DUF2513 domain-containing protein [Entomomonas moraniae]AZS50380.1 DUF2513 domain-containing protein [Entomomonas moraniae]